VVSATVLALILAGCTRESGETPDGTPSPTGATVTPGVDEVGATPGEDGFPAEAQEYAEAAVAAWAAPDLIRLDELTTAAVHDEIIELPGPPDLAWTFIRCEDTVSASVCSFHNTDGDYLVLEVDHGLLTEASAVVEAEFQITAYPDEVQEYVEAFVAAWQEGNPPRMNNLATADAAAVLQQLPPAPVIDYQTADPDDQLTTVVVILAGAEVETRVSNGLLGEPLAIRQAVLRDH
jgi:hypothetical protein